MIGSSFQSSLYLRSPSNLYAIGSSFQSKLKPLSSHQLLEIGSSFQSSLNLWSLSNLYAIRSSFSEHAEPPSIPPTVRDRKLLLELTESPIAQQSVCNLNESDPRSNVHYLSSSENKAFFHNDQLLVGFLAQLVERCTGISEVMGSNPVQAWIFFRPYFHYCSSSAHYCEDQFHSGFYPQFKYMTFIHS